MPTVNELINAGYGGYAGWGDAEANADFNATGGAGKITGGGGRSGASIPAFNFDYAGAEAKAMADLTPYYTKLLQMYGGDVALAKQRLDQDYERGLRVKTTATEWEKQTNEIQRAERQRKFDIALKDLDQQMNQRGIYTSGITTQAENKAKADEAYQQAAIDRQNQELDRGLQQYKEQAGADYLKGVEDLGYAKPQQVNMTSQYAPDQTGIKSPGASYNIANFAPQTAQKEVSLEEQKRKDAYEKAMNAWSRAYSQWSADATRLAQG